MTIKQLVKICHKIAVEKGFWSEVCFDCKGKKKIEIWRTSEQRLDHLPLAPRRFKKCIEKCETCNGTGQQFLDRNNGEMIALMHSELSEALEDLRNGNDKHVGEELADCVIRIMDYCGGRDIDLEKILEKKIKKNKRRPYKHGKTF